MGYGKSEAKTFRAGEALAMATSLAIRDGGARISTEIPLQPKVVRWLDELQRVEGD